MSSQIPYCGSCRQQRDAEPAITEEHKAARRKTKCKTQAAWESESDEEDEWGAGEPGIMKPDITFFGQALDSEFDECLYRDREEVDLLVIIGTSLKVAPVSEVLSRFCLPPPYLTYTDEMSSVLQHIYHILYHRSSSISLQYPMSTLMCVKPSLAGMTNDGGLRSASWATPTRS